MHRDDSADRPTLIGQVGSTRHPRRAEQPDARDVALSGSR
jgi:hypothetical protein